MSKPTGPGKINELSRKGDAKVRRKALLFNFDFDGDQVKAEHQKWLVDNVVPLLGNLNLTINLRGLASRSGSAAYNKQLSERRVGNVKKFLISKGATPSQIQGFGAGESDAEVAGQANGTEDEAFRGVVVTLGSGRPNKIKFEQVFPQHKENGFDPNAFPNPWLLVHFETPNRELRVVNAAGFLIRSSNPNVAVPVSFPGSRPLTNITTDDEVFRVNGRLPGDATIDITDSQGNIQATLEVHVGKKLKVQTAFFYVKHTTVGTTRRLGAETAMLRLMNEIYLPQANIEFVSLEAKDLPLSDAFGNEVNESARMANLRTEWEQLTMNRRRDARFNVFFVKELEQAATEGGGDLADALATIGGVDCVFEDDAGSDVGETLAHEAGHSLGCRHNTPITSTIDMLMWDTTDERGRFIPKVHALLMRSKV